MQTNEWVQAIQQNPEQYFIVFFKLKNQEKSGANKLSACEIANIFEQNLRAFYQLDDINLLKVEINKQEETKIIEVASLQEQNNRYNVYRDIPFLEKILDVQILNNQQEEENDENNYNDYEIIDTKYEQLHELINLFFQYHNQIDKIKQVELENKFNQLMGYNNKILPKFQTKLLVQVKGKWILDLHQKKLYVQQEKEPLFLDLIQQNQVFKNKELEQGLTSKIIEIEDFSFGTILEENTYQIYYNSQDFQQKMTLEYKIILKDIPQNYKLLSILIIIRNQFIIRFDIDLTLCKEVNQYQNTFYFRMLSPPMFSVALPGRFKYENDLVKSNFVRVDNLFLNKLINQEEISEIQRLILINNTTIKLNVINNQEFVKNKIDVFKLYKIKTQPEQKNLFIDTTYIKLLQNKHLNFAIKFSILSVISQNRLNNITIIQQLIDYCENEIKKLKIKNEAPQKISGIFDQAFNQFIKTSQSIIEKDLNNLNIKKFSKLLKRTLNDYIEIVDPEKKLAMIRRISLTPSGILYFNRQPEMTSGILRSNYKIIKYFLRVHFEDENQDPILNIPYITQCFYFKQVYPQLKILNNNYELFTWSSSSLRIGTCWFIDTDNAKQSRIDIINHIGNFTNLKQEEIAKNAARLGQNLSTSFTLTIKEPLNIKIQEDIKDIRGKLYTDGIGMIAENVIQNLRNKINNQNISAIQIRFEGAKGLLVLNNNLADNQIILRRSMVKYNPSKDGYGGKIYILDFNKFRGGYLNRQIIILLLTLGIKNQVFQELQNEYIQQIEDLTMKDSSIYHYFNTDYIEEQSLIPNIIEIIRSYINVGIQDNLLCQGVLSRLKERGLLQLRKKTTILVKKAARVLGVTDEFQLLEEDEIFCLIYDGNIYKEPYNVIGEVMVTRNPCLHPGDIKKYKAISEQEIKQRFGNNNNINPYNQLKNCLVFSQKGKSQPCQIAGGDLDGDLYFITWDSRLIPPIQEQSMQYDQQLNLKNPTKNFKENNQIFLEGNQNTLFPIKGMLQFLFLYMNSDVLGKIDNSHLVWADQSDIYANDPNCLELSELHSEAVDFIKHGRPVYVDPKLICKLWPDFMEKDFSQTYESKTIIGELYRQVKSMGSNDNNNNNTIFNLGYNQVNLPEIQEKYIYNFNQLIEQCKILQQDIIITISIKEIKGQQNQIHQQLEQQQIDQNEDIESQNNIIPEIQLLMDDYINQNFVPVIPITLNIIYLIFENLYGICNIFDVKNEFEIYSGNFTNFTKGDGLYHKKKINTDKFQKRIISQLMNVKQQIFAILSKLDTEILQNQCISLIIFILAYSPQSHPYPQYTLIGLFIQKIIPKLQEQQLWNEITRVFTQWYRGAGYFFFSNEFLKLQLSKNDELI